YLAAERARYDTQPFFIRCSYHGFMKMDLRISIKHYHHASVWCEFVAFRTGEMQPGAGGTSSHQTEADAIACSLNAGRDERAGNDGRRAGAILARPPCLFPARWSRWPHATFNSVCVFIPAS